MKIKGAIFDLDGTLLDSMSIWDTIGEDYLISRGIIPEEGLNKKFKEMSIMQAAQYYRTVYGINDSSESIINGVNSMIEHMYSETVQAKDGVIQLLEAFQNSGVNMCVATATDRYMVEAGLLHNNISEYFSEILTCSEVGFGKDSPEIFEQAAKHLGADKADILVFEDALHAVKTAKGAGFTVVGVYDKYSDDDQEEIRRIADFYLPNYNDWAEWMII